MLNKKIKKRYLLILGFIFIVIFTFGKFIYPAVRQPKKNVILIVVDSLRPDHLGCYGYQKNTSPNIDSLAKRGTLFTQAITQGSYTAASVASIFTSTYPHTNWVVDYGDQLDPSLLTLAQVLKNHGYSTALISTHFDLYSTIPSFTRGFDYDLSIHGLDATVTELATEWLKDNQDRPFFLYLHYMEVHYPYQPPPPYNSLYLDDRLKGIEAATLETKYKWMDDPSLHGIPKQIVEGNITNEDIDYYISQYDGTIRSTDEQVGILSKELERLNLDKKTIIVLTADHGEDLAEHDVNRAFRHAGVYCDVVLKVPLIIKCNNVIPQGKAVTQQIQSIDIMPTILDILEIKQPEGIEGVSLLPLILKGKKYPSLYAFSNFGNDEYVIRTEEWKLIKDGTGYKLYNLKRDPEELIDLIDVERERFVFLKKELDNWEKQKKTKGEITPQPLTEEQKERLRSMGYLQ